MYQTRNQELSRYYLTQHEGSLNIILTLQVKELGLTELGECFAKTIELVEAAAWLQTTRLTPDPASFSPLPSASPPAVPGTLKIVAPGSLLSSFR